MLFHLINKSQVLKFIHLVLEQYFFLLNPPVVNQKVCQIDSWDAFFFATS